MLEFIPSSAGADTRTSSGEWSLGGHSAYRNNAAAPGGGRSVLTANTSTTIRPTTGLARVINRPASSLSVPTQDASYYHSLIQDKIETIVDEIDKLKAETDSQNRTTLERKHNELSKVVADLEGELADLNLTKEYLRAGTSPEDIHKSSLSILGRNAKMEEVVDKVFFERKKVENQINELKGGMAGGDGDKTNEREALVFEIESILLETKQQESEAKDAVLLLRKIKMDNSLHHSHAKIEELKSELERVKGELEMAQMTEAETENYLLGKVSGLQEMERESSRLELESSKLKMEQKALRSYQRALASRSHERVFRKDRDMRQRLDQDFPQLKAELENEMNELKSRIEFLSHIIKEKGNAANKLELPSGEELEMMKDESAFTTKHLQENRETTALLEQEKKARNEDLAAVFTLEERIKDEVDKLDRRMAEVSKELETYSSPMDHNRNNEAAVKGALADFTLRFAHRAELLGREKEMALLQTSAVWKDLDELKAKLCREGLELQCSYSSIKENCMALIGDINETLKSMRH